MSVSVAAHILVVDDEPDLCWAMSIMLRPLGAQITTATSGAAALSYAMEQTFDLIFIDAILPDTDGLSLVQMLMRFNPDAGVVLMSGYYDAEDPAVRMQLEDQRLIGFLAKPFEITQVRRIARNALGRQEQQYGAGARC